MKNVAKCLLAGLLAVSMQWAEAATPYAPVPVQKARATKIYAHLMPWFESREYSGYWGQHWTMSNKNPDVIEAGDRRQIAAYYYPLTGPYASADPDLVEYQLLLMKLSGIDGVLIDWPGTTNLYDYPRNKSNSEAVINKLPQVGLSFGIIYEDQNIRIAHEAGAIQDRIGQARADMSYLRDNYFNRSNYIRHNNRPWLGVFGPQTFQNANDWNTIFSVFSNAPCFITLWYESGEAPQTCVGEYSWIYQDGNPHINHLTNFYNNRPPFNFKMGSVYPGFNAFYAAGGWGGNPFYIAANGSGTFRQTLDLALNSNVGHIQLATWNDYGEGTMIEPTREFGYSLLTYLQERLGVNYRQPELELVHDLYKQRKQYKGNAAQQDRLTQAFYYLVSLQIGNARNELNRR